MFKVSSLSQGFSQVEIDLTKLFDTRKQYDDFIKQFKPFIASDPLNNLSRGQVSY